MLKKLLDSDGVDNLMLAVNLYWDKFIISKPYINNSGGIIMYTYEVSVINKKYQFNFKIDALHSKKKYFIINFTRENGVIYKSNLVDSKYNDILFKKLKSFNYECNI